MLIILVSCLFNYFGGQFIYNFYSSKKWNLYTVIFIRNKKAIVYYRKRFCTRERDLVLQKAIWYYRKRFCTTKRDLVLQKMIWYYRKRFGTTERDLVLQKAIWYYRKPYGTTEKDLVLQKAIWYYKEAILHCKKCPPCEIIVVWHFLLYNSRFLFI